MTTPTTADPASEPATVQVRDFIDAAQLKRDLAFTTNDLSSAMMEQSSLFAHYGQLSAEASRQVDVLKMLLENTEAAVYKLLRNEAATKAEKVTEAQLEKSVARHSRVIGMKKALNEAKRIEATGKIAVESFRHRRDMLVQMGLLERVERQGDLRIMDRNAKDEVAAGQRERALAALSKARAE
ncbi:MAG: hypothetical protein DI537_14670 [Stutzerimonas stutzeri]|nr:MAG: hypothetical protein DI537_14670 [Stutzerimonas stutzeri]